MGEWNVDKILHTLTAKQFRGWEHFHELSPFGDYRADLRIATVTQMLYNINRGKGEKARPLEDFLLKFDGAKKKEKTWQEMAQTARLIAMMYNAAGKND